MAYKDSCSGPTSIKRLEPDRAATRTICARLASNAIWFGNLFMPVVVIHIQCPVKAFHKLVVIAASGQHLTAQVDQFSSSMVCPVEPDTVTKKHTQQSFQPLQLPSVCLPPFWHLPRGSKAAHCLSSGTRRSAPGRSGIGNTASNPRKDRLMADKQRVMPTAHEPYQRQPLIAAVHVPRMS